MPALRSKTFGRIAILPWVSIQVFVIAMALLVGGVFALEHLLIPWLEDRHLVASVGWWQENERLVYNLRRTGATHDTPLMHMPADPPPAPAKTRKRVLVIGDSFVWGDGYANLNDLWWRQLERELAEKNHDVEVIAAGWGGVGTAKELEYARALIPRYDPDAVIFGYVTNDAGEGLVPQFVAQVDPTFEFLNKWGDPRVEHPRFLAFPNLWRVLFVLHETKQAAERGGPQNGYDYHQWEMETLKGPNFEKYRQTVSALGDLCREYGRPCFAIALPGHPSREYFEPRYAPVKPLFAAAGVPFHDILDELIAGHADILEQPILEWGINPGNRHPSARVSYFFGQKAADILVRNYPEVVAPQLPRVERPLRINDWLPADLPILERPSGAEVKFTATVSNLTLRLPGRRPYLQFNLETTFNVSQVILEGAPGLSAEVLITQINPRIGKHDPGVPLSLGASAAASRPFEVPEGCCNPLSTVRIAGPILESGAAVTLKLVP